MTYSRFRTISQFLPFSSDSSLNKDKLFIIREIVTIFQKNWQINYIPKQNISIDERIIPFKGRLRIKQYAPRKASQI